MNKITYRIEVRDEGVPYILKNSYGHIILGFHSKAKADGYLFSKRYALSEARRLIAKAKGE